MKIVKKVSIKELGQMAQKMDGNIVKADVDVANKIVIIDMPMHFEGEQKLLERGSKQSDLWGINLIPAKYGTNDFVMFESMINIKPKQDNSGMTIKSGKLRSKIKNIIDEVVHE